MEIILLQDIDKVGEKHSVVTVKDGYARNYLIPQKLAVVANKANTEKLDELKRKEAEQLAQRIAEFQEVADKLKEKVLKIGAKAGQSEKIFGSVTNLQIANAIKEQFDIDIERRKVELPEEVKMLGTYTAKLNLHPDVDASITFEVIAE